MSSLCCITPHFVPKQRDRKTFVSQSTVQPLINCSVICPLTDREIFIETWRDRLCFQWPTKTRYVKLHFIQKSLLKKYLENINALSCNLLYCMLLLQSFIIQFKRFKKCLPNLWGCKNIMWRGYDSCFNNKSTAGRQAHLQVNRE